MGHHAVRILEKIVTGSLLLICSSFLFGQEPAAPMETLGQIQEFRTYYPIEGVTSTRIYADTVQINYVTIKKGVSSNHHLHPDEQIMLFDTGTAIAYIADREYEVGPGDILLIPSNVPHHFFALENATWREVHGPGFRRPAN
jgi:quercetin dioxygenase-like cupin family protein